MVQQLFLTFTIRELIFLGNTVLHAPGIYPLNLMINQLVIVYPTEIK